MVVRQATDEAVSFQPEAGAESKSVAVLGATGSIGTSTLDVIRNAPELYRAQALTAQSNVTLLTEQALEFQPDLVVIGDEAHYPRLRDALSGTNIHVAAGLSGLIEAASIGADIVVGGIVGAAGIRPSLAALETGSVLALANKECLVCAGDLFTQTARRVGRPILPVDSEHNAIFQIFETEHAAEVESVILTASGGPFRTWSQDQINRAGVEDALKHPNWSMGARITIDSATMMNKGFELIEAHHLFPVEANQLEVLVHPQSIIHGLVRYSDGSVLAELAAPDMRVAISHSLAWPQRKESPAKSLDLAKIGTLTFEEPDLERFPALGLAIEAMKTGGMAPAVLNAADEVAVEAFLKGQIRFVDIARIVNETLEKGHQLFKAVETVDEIFTIDRESRVLATELI
ncbi:1-deoxy-D-xylulose-5-phosphate reductoisomerase [Coralliovum pocilloporae]|uniref:1-deoxy-D-xylulose-5-phosphate reductoisomerase n=1 Tax=Coralliovum pocilloporae TaxID=3066369 RepID=UPI0033074051